MKIPSIELIWSGLGDYNVNIMADGMRELDAFFVIQGENKIRFQTRAPTTTNPRFNLPLLDRGTYILEYSVITSNFSVASRVFLLKYLGSHSDIEFTPQ